MPSTDIVLVEKNQDLQLLILKTMERIGRRVIAFSDGPSALVHIAAEPPALVITDWDLQSMGGADFCRRVGARGMIPVVVYASEVPDAKARLDASITKVVLREGSLRNLLEAVNSVLPSPGA